MATFKPSGFTVQNVYTEIHRLLLIAKESHYRTKKFAAHEAFGRTYDSLVELIDTITEQLIGYSGIDPIDIPIGTIAIREPKQLGDEIISFASRLISFADEKEYHNIENLAQELSGIGAQLNYLSRF